MEQEPIKLTDILRSSYLKLDLTYAEAKMLVNILSPYAQLPFITDDIQYMSAKLSLVCEKWMHTQKGCRSKQDTDECFLAQNIISFKYAWKDRINKDPNQPNL